MEDKRNSYRSLVQSPEGKEPYGKHGIRREITLKYILNRIG
jgi:hypothetical protein